MTKLMKFGAAAVAAAAFAIPREGRTAPVEQGQVEPVAQRQTDADGSEQRQSGANEVEQTQSAPIAQRQSAPIPAPAVLLAFTYREPGVCGPCDFARPIVKRLTAEYPIEFLYADSPYGADQAAIRGVAAFPTFIYTQRTPTGERELARWSGAADFERKIREIFRRFGPKPIPPKPLPPPPKPRPIPPKPRPIPPKPRPHRA